MIPKIIHYCWLSNEPYPSIVEHCIKTWKLILPDYNFILWNSETFNLNHNKWVSQSFNSNKYAFTADYIRLYVLYKYGGIYLDTDVEVLKSFNDLLNTNSFIGLEQGGEFEAAVIGSVQHSSWLEEVLKYYDNREFIINDKIYDTTPLPIILDKYLNFNFSQLNDNINIYNSDYFSPKNRYSNKLILTNNTYCVHHFNASWVDCNFKNIFKHKLHKTLISIFNSNNHFKIIYYFRKYFN